MQRQFCITFAAPVGASKTPIATYLSWNLGLPIWNNDAIRSEIAEDMGSCPEDELRRRAQERIEQLLRSQRSFIADVSVMHDWATYSSLLEKANYEILIISIDLTREHLERMYLAKGYDESLKRLDQLMETYNHFMEAHTERCGIFVTESNFPQRLEFVLGEVKKWLEKRVD